MMTTCNFTQMVWFSSKYHQNAWTHQNSPWCLPLSFGLVYRRYQGERLAEGVMWVTDYRDDWICVVCFFTVFCGCVLTDFLVAFATSINRLSFQEAINANLSGPITSRNDDYNFSVYQRICWRFLKPGLTGQSVQSTFKASQSNLIMTLHPSNSISVSDSHGFNSSDWFFCSSYQGT